MTSQGTADGRSQHDSVPAPAGRRHLPLRALSSGSFLCGGIHRSTV